MHRVYDFCPECDAETPGDSSGGFTIFICSDCGYIWEDEDDGEDDEWSRP